MIKKILYCVLILFLFADIGYSFLQHLCQPLDGDMASIIVPADDVKPVLDSPFGLGVILKNQSYPNPNRFFSHWAMKEYFISAPLILQNFVKPIDSIYLSSAIFKTLLQIVIILLLALAISGTKNILKLDFIVAAAIVTPLFQTNGFQNYMGIIDPAPTYTFFYALPSALLLLYISPFILQYYHDKRPTNNTIIKIISIPLAIVICLSGPTNTGVVLIFSLIVFTGNLQFNYIHSNQDGILRRVVKAIHNIPKGYWFYLLPISIFSIYSLYIGTYNSSNVNIPVIELYSRIPKGIYFQFLQKLGFPVLFIIITLNIVLLKYIYKSSEANKTLRVFMWIGLFVLLYILLLPLGGYRTYRQNILRYDTIMPITLAVMFVFGNSTLIIVKSITKKHKLWYLPLIVIVLFIFTNADKINLKENKCEKIALHKISESKDKIVQIENDCHVLSWDKIIEPEESELEAQLLFMWKVTDVNRLYYNK